jgi:hypothetical protein
MMSVAPKTVRTSYPHCRHQERYSQDSFFLEDLSPSLSHSRADDSALPNVSRILNTLRFEEVAWAI